MSYWGLKPKMVYRCLSLIVHLSVFATQVTWRPTFQLCLTRIFFPWVVHRCITLYEGLFEDSSCLMNHCVYAGETSAKSKWKWHWWWCWWRRRKSPDPSGFCLWPSLNALPHMSAVRVLSMETHQKTYLSWAEGGKEQMSRKIDKTWGCLTKSTDRTCQTFFLDRVTGFHAAVLNLFGASGSMNDVTSLWQDLMKYCWYVTCQRWLAWLRKKTKLLAFNHALFWHPIPRAFLAQSESMATTDSCCSILFSYF